jgi:hypothetical protein
LQPAFVVEEFEVLFDLARAKRVHGGRDLLEFGRHLQQQFALSLLREIHNRSLKDDCRQHAHNPCQRD